MAGAGEWVKIRYKRNRGIIHDGDFPHFSSPIETIPNEKRRVILGFNFFSAAVADCNSRAPEHSDAFNRTVKLYQVHTQTCNVIVPTLIMCCCVFIDYDCDCGNRIFVPDDV
jgi:hypothetical protein